MYKKKVLFILVCAALLQAADSSAQNSMRSIMSRYLKILKESPLTYQSRPVDWQEYATNSRAAQPLLSSKVQQTVLSLQDRLAQKQYRSVEQQLQQMLAADSNRAPLLFLRGETARLQGDTNSAARWYYRALLVMPDYEKCRNSTAKMSGAGQPRKVVERATVRRDGRTKVNIVYDEQFRRKPLQLLWFIFGISRALWQYEGFFYRYYPQAPFYYRSFAELLFSYRLLLDSWQEVRDKYSSAIKGAAGLNYLLKLYTADLLEGYLFFEVYRRSYFGPENALLKKYRTSIAAYYRQKIINRTR